jgi:hypothetical protein
MFYAVGDIHGYTDVMLGLLHKAGLIDVRAAWCGGDATLVFVGDFVDRGPDSIGTVENVMRLQAEAKAAGGRVLATLGNHDLALVLAKRYPDALAGGGESFLTFWEWIGGSRADLAMPDSHVDWLASLPVMLTLGDTLIMHSDSSVYTDYGGDVDQVNGRVERLLERGDTVRLAALVRDLGRHQDFWSKPERAAPFLATFEARRLLHGHTPIHKHLGKSADEVNKPLIYAWQRCINLDGGIYLGGPGFVYASDEE